MSMSSEHPNPLESHTGVVANPLDEYRNSSEMEELSHSVKVFLMEHGYLFEPDFMEAQSNPSNIYFVYAPGFRAFALMKRHSLMTTSPYVFIKFERELSFKDYIFNDSEHNVIDPNVNYFAGNVKATIGRDSFGRKHLEFILRAVLATLEDYKKILTNNNVSNTPKNVMFLFIATQVMNFYHNTDTIRAYSQQYLLDLIAHDITGELAFIALVDGIYKEENSTSPKWSIESLLSLKELPLNYAVKLMQG